VSPHTRRAAKVLVGLSSALGIALLGVACSSNNVVTPDAGLDGGRLTDSVEASCQYNGLGLGDGGTFSGVYTVPCTPCKVTIETPPVLCDDMTTPCRHVQIGSDVTYNSNPPSSGDHYATWAAYQTWQHPIDHRNYVHNLEHGAIVFLYNCQNSGGCDDFITGLQQASRNLFDDPVCTNAGQNVRVRSMVTPDPSLDVPVAAAAWVWVYKAECLDVVSLTDFARQRYGWGPEINCQQGDNTL
jgi:hypothetical protein